ncbi:hypothetical protein KIL84_018795 [Mauremys mutica]|uniref:Uncharacterized protein n=1 Tax=Mauremys mutica TaxID=74926 RepID=A0A9D4B9Q5_9SAUR|nr:hypothetical protein KIL84_018795 [Mauremys mutica]
MLDCQVWNILSKLKGFQKKIGPYFCPHSKWSKAVSLSQVILDKPYVTGGNIVQYSEECRFYKLFGVMDSSKIGAHLTEYTNRTFHSVWCKTGQLILLEAILSYRCLCK